MKTAETTWPALIVESIDGAEIEIRIVGTALLKPGRYSLVRVEEIDESEESQGL